MNNVSTNTICTKDNKLQQRDYACSVV